MHPNQSLRNMFRPLAMTFAAASLLALSPVAVLAAEKLDATATTIKQNLESRYPGSHVVDVQPSAIPGLYEVFTGEQIVYSDVTGDYLIIGSMVDTQTKKNMTDVRLSDRGKIDFKSLPLNQAIKVVKGNGSRVFAVFSDPDCPYCRQLEQTLMPMTDVTMYVFLYPIASLHPQAPEKAHTIWCAADRAQAWTQWMLEKKLPATKACSDPIDALHKLGGSMRINSTPTIFFADGRRISGALPQADLERELAAARTPQRSASN